jgi:integrase
MARRQRNIYKRKNGSYEARFIKERCPEGKAVYASVYAKTYSEVKKKLELKKASACINQSTSSGTRQKVVCILEKHLEDRRLLIKPSTYWLYQGYLENHVKPFFSNLRCGRLNRETVQTFVTAKHENGLAATTIQSVFFFIKNGLANVVGKSIFEICLPKRDNAGVDVLTMDEQNRLDAAAGKSDDINKVGITLSLYTGIRVGELCGLMWQDIDFDEKQMHIRRTLQRIKSGNGKSKTALAFQTPKSGSSMRSIPLPEFLIFILREHRVKSTGKYVLCLKGNVVEPRVMQYRFKRLLEAAGIRERPFHITRHCFSVRALENCMDIKTLSEILGHASPVITLKKYAHVLDEHKRKSMERMTAVYQR